MRFLKIDILVLSMLLVGLLIGGVANAKTFNFTFEANTRSDPNDPNSPFDVSYTGTDLAMGDEVQFSLFGETPIADDGSGIQFFTVAFVFDDLLFDYGSNFSSSIPGKNAIVGTPSYILYAPAAGAIGTTILYPVPEPFQFAPPTPADQRAIQVSWVESNTAPAAAQFDPDLGTLIANLILTARSGDSASATPSDVAITLTDSPGTILRVDDENVIQAGDTLPDDLPAGFIVTVQDAITINVPEPTTAGLSIAALAALVAIRIRRGRASV
jgi:hypothetical protein